LGQMKRVARWEGKVAKGVSKRGRLRGLAYILKTKKNVGRKQVEVINKRRKKSAFSTSNAGTSGGREARAVQERKEEENKDHFIRLKKKDIRLFRGTKGKEPKKKKQGNARERKNATLGRKRK